MILAVIGRAGYLLRKTGKLEIIIEKLKQLLSIIGIIFMDKGLVLNALNSDFKDFEDAYKIFQLFNMKKFILSPKEI